MSSLYPLPVSSIKRLTPSAVGVGFEIPENLKSLFSYSSGQYLTLGATINDEVVRRSYSLSSTPKENELIVGIKKIEGGRFSSFANDILKVGDVIDVAPPEGRFIFSPTDKKQHLLLIAAGSGITPVFSILKSALEDSSETSVTLIYGNKTPDESIFKSELEKLENTFKNRFNVIWVYSQSNEEKSLFGRIDESTIHFTLNKIDLLPDAVYICGPEGMILTAKDTLVAKLVPEKAIHFELFKMTKPKSLATKENDSTVTLSITSDEETQEIELVGNKTILEAALQHKIDVPYSCQGGVCCSCIARVTDGAAVMESNQVLTDDEVEEGLILTCQAVPTTSKIAVDYDDV